MADRPLRLADASRSLGYVGDRDVLLRAIDDALPSDAAPRKG
jgi:hypothetical protein